MLRAVSLALLAGAVLLLVGALAATVGGALGSGRDRGA
jgi:hypothetical protein